MRLAPNFARLLACLVLCAPVLAHGRGSAPAFSAGPDRDEVLAAGSPFTFTGAGAALIGQAPWELRWSWMSATPDALVLTAGAGSAEPVVTLTRNGPALLACRATNALGHSSVRTFRFWGAPSPQTVYFNRVPWWRWDQNRDGEAGLPEALFTDMIKTLGPPAPAARRWGIQLTYCLLGGDLDIQARNLKRALDLARKHQVPILIVLDGFEWWGLRKDLWNWWDPSDAATYNPDNVYNVEWTWSTPEAAVKCGWRNWGVNMRVEPHPNLNAPRYIQANLDGQARLIPVILKWFQALPEAERHLFGGVKIGWETALNANYDFYPDGNKYWGTQEDPAFDFKWDKAWGGLVPLGYAALAQEGIWSRAVTLADCNRISQKFLERLCRQARDLGIPGDRLFTHSGGQRPPWKEQHSFAASLNEHAIPGWSFYGWTPDTAGDLKPVMQAAGRQEWSAAEWLPDQSATIGPEAWTQACRDILEQWGANRFVVVYNWEGVGENPRAMAGIRSFLGLAP